MHLFAGAGGGLLADRILGHTPVVAVEWDKYCCQVLRERAEDGWFPGLHVWEGDVRLFDPSEYAGKVDCVAAGFPCQDISSAGNQAGVGEGTRSGLYREVLRIADVVRPRYLFLENVAAILDNQFLGTVLGDLAARGFDARWTCLPASAAGAPHYRDRWWCLAERADTDSERELQPQGDRREKRGWIGNVGEGVADSMRLGAQGERPCGIDAQGWQNAGERSHRPCRHGVGWWDVEPRLGRVADGVADRTHRIKALGNGQVPQQAALAWVMLGGP